MHPRGLHIGLLLLMACIRPFAKIPVPMPSSHTTKSDKSLSRPSELTEQGRLLELAIEAAANTIINLTDCLNEWESKVGDGDCGSTMYRGATAILEALKTHYPLNDAAETISEIGSSLRRVMGGTSGIIYVIFCKAAYAQLKSSGETEISAKQWAEALEAAIAAVSKYGGARAGFRTMLDSLIPASVVLNERLYAGDDPITAFISSSEAAAAGAESTQQMEAHAGRSSYISANILATVPRSRRDGRGIVVQCGGLSVERSLLGRVTLNLNLKGIKLVLMQSGFFLFFVF